MSDERSPVLERLFAVANRELDDEAFVVAVVEKTKARSRKRLLIAFAACVVAAPVAWVVAGPLNAALIELMGLVSQPIAPTNGIANPIVLPMNSIGGAIVLGFLALRALARRLVH
jgi:hypothetical protein